jgi:hypothetical protein
MHTNASTDLGSGIQIHSNSLKKNPLIVHVRMLSLILCSSCFCKRYVTCIADSEAKKKGVKVVPLVGVGRTVSDELHFEVKSGRFHTAGASCSGLRTDGAG